MTDNNQNQAQGKNAPAQGAGAAGANKVVSEDRAREQTAGGGLQTGGPPPAQQNPVNAARARERGRGNLAGERANIERQTNLVDWPPIPKTHEEHVEELLERAEENQTLNYALNAAQTEAAADATERIGNALYPLTDPADEEEARAQVLQEAKDALDPNVKNKRLKGEMDARAKRDKARAERQYGT